MNGTPMPQPSSPQVPPPQIPSAPAMPPTPVQPAYVEKEQNNMRIIIGVLIVLIVLLTAFILYSVTKPQKQIAVPTPTPQLPTPTPTPVRQLSPLASTSAYLQYDIAVTELSTSIGGYNAQDPALSPPVLVLPLGLSN